MTGKTIHELLELPEHVTSPHAYQVFGLNPGESNAAAIQEAIARRITQLKAAKSSTAPETWSRAAQVLQTAQRTLTDPKKKAKLDARFGIVSMDDASSTKTASHSATATPQKAAPSDTAKPIAPAAPAVDPLAALLPTGNASNNTQAAPVASTQPAARASDNQSATEIVDATLVADPVVNQVNVTPAASPAAGIGPRRSPGGSQQRWHHDPNQKRQLESARPTSRTGRRAKRTCSTSSTNERWDHKTTGPRSTQFAGLAGQFPIQPRCDA